MELILVATELDNSSERIINFLAGNFGVPINAVFFRYFKERGEEFITRTWLVDPQEAEVRASKSPGKKGREFWNGKDFSVSFGPPESRDWEDARDYGFVSGGGKKWFSQTLSQLFPGSRVFVNVPGYGYVGVGEVIEEMQPMKDFMVDVNGKKVPITEAPLKSKNLLTRDQNNPDKAEYMVRVNWIKTLPIEKAYWEKGMYANQNTATKLRNKFTLDRLINLFGLEE